MPVPYQPAYKALGPPLLLSSQQRCEVEETESEAQGHPGHFMAKKGFEPGPLWHNLVVTFVLK